jgi:hypothetical protein
MIVTSIIACPKCGQKLGIPGDRGIVHVICPKCTGQWDWPAKSPSGASANTTGQAMPPSGHAAASESDPPRYARWFSSLRYKRRTVMGVVFLGLVVFICYHMLAHILTYTRPKPLSGTDTSLSESRRAIWNPPPEQPLPENGYGVFRFNQPAADSKLRVSPRGEQGHVVLKVEGADDARLVCWIFIRQGESAETSIPSGAYRLKLACGKRWYGEEHLFGPGASYSAITTEIKIPTHTAYTIDLHPSTGGTLMQRTLRPQDF